MCRCIKGTTRGLNPIEPSVYSPACSTKVDRLMYILFARVRRLWQNVPPYLPQQCKCLLSRVVQKAATCMGRQCGLHASTTSLMNIITRQQRGSHCKWTCQGPASVRSSCSRLKEKKLCQNSTWKVCHTFGSLRKAFANSVLVMDHSYTF